MSTKALFPYGGGSNLILGTGMGNQMFILRTPATIKFLNQILKNCHFGVKTKNHHPPGWICIAHICHRVRSDVCMHMWGNFKIFSY